MKERWEMGTQTMLDRLRNTGTARDIALELFQSKYRYLIFAIASEYGLSDTEADELLSIVLREVWQHTVAEHYQDQRKPFRAFLRTVIKRRALDLIRKRKTWQVSLEDSYQQQDEDEDEDDFNLEHLPDADAENPFRLVEMQFDRMYYRNLILYGLKELRKRINEETYQIFDLAMIQRRPSKDVADFFDVTVNYVNKVKRDNCERLRQMLQEFIEHGDNLPFNTEEEFEQEVTATIANFKEWV